MSGAYYLALGGMRARLGALDRLASDIANVSTAGYKAERATTAQSDRPDFGATLSCHRRERGRDAHRLPRRRHRADGTRSRRGHRWTRFLLGGHACRRAFHAGRPIRPAQRRRAHDLAGVSRPGHERSNDGGQRADHVDADGIALRSGAAIAGRLKIVEFDDTAALSRANTLCSGGRRDASTPPRTRRCVPARSSSRTCRSSIGSPN